MTLYEEILALIEVKDVVGLKNLLATTEELEFLDAFYDLSDEAQVITFRLLTKSKALSIFEELDTDEQQNLLRSFTGARAIELINEMAPDDRVKLLDEMPAGVAQKLIVSLSKDERAVTNSLMGYKPETAGRIMTPEYISLRKNMTAAQALEKVRKQAKDKETIYTLFVTDDRKKLEGVLALKELIVADVDSKIEDIMSKKPISVFTDTDQEEVARTLQELDILAIPVVDREELLVGIVTIDDAVDILEEEATEDILDQAGLADITGNESDRSEVLIKGNLWQIWKVRMPFLLATMIIGLLIGFVVGGFEDILEATAAAMFMPLVMGMGGNVGTQSSTVFARGVVLGHIQIRHFFKHFMKEIWIGFSIGAIVGILSGVVAAIWIDVGLGIALALAMIITMTIAALLGFLVPYILIKLNVDQAAGSAPIITTLKDLVALVIYFVCVSLFLGLM